MAERASAKNNVGGTNKRSPQLERETREYSRDDGEKAKEAGLHSAADVDRDHLLNELRASLLHQEGERAARSTMHETSDLWCMGAVRATRACRRA